ncbi:MAG: hypothetical protein K2I18_00485 [Paramuribaculum sp.]|nr:hypothetical protein [Paramuribaculum sp.]
MKEDKETNRILTQVDHNDGMTVPDGYFAQFAARMEELIPESITPPAPAVRTTWQKIRPYVYMAAMFAGIWCMMKMFDLMRPSSPVPGAMLAEAISDDSFMSDYYFNTLNENELLDNLFEEGYTPADIINE